MFGFFKSKISARDLGIDFAKMQMAAYVGTMPTRLERVRAAGVRGREAKLYYETTLAETTLISADFAGTLGWSPGARETQDNFAAVRYMLLEEFCKAVYPDFRIDGFHGMSYDRFLHDTEAYITAFRNPIVDGANLPWIRLAQVELGRVDKRLEANNMLVREESMELGRAVLAFRSVLQKAAKKFRIQASNE